MATLSLLTLPVKERKILEANRYKTLEDKIVLRIPPSETLEKNFHGLDDIKEDLITYITIDYPSRKLHFPQTFLFFGPTGSGKSKFANCLLGSIAQINSNFTFIVPTTLEIFSKWEGHSEQNIMDVFEIARKKKPSIIVMDYIECYKENDGSVWTLLTSQVKQLYKAERNAHKNKGVYFIGITDAPEKLGTSFLNRIDHNVYFQLQNKFIRKQMFKEMFPIEEYHFDKSFYDMWAKMSAGFCGFDIEHTGTDALNIMFNKVRNRNGSTEEMKNAVLSVEDVTRAVRARRPTFTSADDESYLETFEEFAINHNHNCLISKPLDNGDEKQEVKGCEIL